MNGLARLSGSALVLVCIACGAQPIQGSVADGRGTFALCRYSQMDYDVADSDYKSLWKQREEALARLGTGSNLEPLEAGALSHMDIDAYLRRELLKAVTEALVGAAIGQWLENKDEVRRLSAEFTAREQAVLREIADTIERDVVQRSGGRSPVIETRIRTLYSQQLEPKLRRLQNSLKPGSLSGGRGALIGAAIDTVYGFASRAWDLASRMKVAEGHSRRVLQTELYYLPLLADAQRRLAQADPLVRTRCDRQTHVDARARLSASGTLVSEGECVRIIPDPTSRVVWTRHGGADVMAGPQGADTNTLFATFSLAHLGTILRMESRPLLDAPPAALLMTVVTDEGDGESLYPVAVGSGGLFRMPADGELAFQINDAHLANNRGHFVVAFELAPHAACGS